jgi:hypothetical protein
MGFFSILQMARSTSTRTPGGRRHWFHVQKQLKLSTQPSLMVGFIVYKLNYVLCFFLVAI